MSPRLHEYEQQQGLSVCRVCGMVENKQKSNSLQCRGEPPTITLRKEPVRLDCGDSSCMSPERAYGGMRTNGGCRCEREQVARAYERKADQIRQSPAYRQYGRAYMTGAEVVQRVVQLLRKEAETAPAREVLLRIAEQVENGEWVDTQEYGKAEDQDEQGV